MNTTPVTRFMQQQGFAAEDPQALRSHFSALLFQPWIVGSLTVVAIILQRRELFFALGAVLAWSAGFPQWNPFERLFDWLMGKSRGLPRLPPAPGPRRFAQGMAAGFMLLTGVALSLHWRAVAYGFEAMLLVAFVALLAGKFCLGAYIYHLLHGRAGFANTTCPWSRS